MPAAFQATGFGFTFDDAVGFTAITGAANLTLSFSASTPVLNYSAMSGFEDALIPDVILGGSDVRVASINGVVLDDSIETALGRVNWNGQSADVLVINTGPDTGYFFRLGGAPLPPITTAAEGNAYLASLAQNVQFPPAPLGPNTNISLSAFEGFLPLDLTETTTFTTQGFSFFDIGEDGAIDLQPSQVAVTFNTTSAALFFETTGIDDDIEGIGGTGFSQVRVGFTEAPIAFTLDGQDIALGENAQELLVARFTTSAGVHDVLVFDVYEDGEFGRFHMLQLGGAPLPAGTDAAAVNAFFQSLLSIDPIPAGQPTSEGAQIALSGIPGVSIATDVTTPPPVSEATGDPGVVFLNGYILFETGDTVTAFQDAELSVAVPIDNGLQSYTILGYDDGDLPLVDFAGMEPYVVMINGNAVGQGEASIARLTIDAETYYDVMFFFAPDPNVYALFQIGGSGDVIDFTTTADADLFANSFQAIGQVGAIPLGQPFAPDADFSLLDSSFARLDGNPLILEGGSFTRGVGGANYGRGVGTVGTVTVVNGAELEIHPNGSDGPFVSVGRDGGRGDMVVAGPDSTISVTAGGGNAGVGSEGVAISVGRDGGNGSLRVLDKATFVITDPTGTSAGATGFGSEFMTIGRGLGASGVVDVNDASFLMSGTGVEIYVGWQSGDGELWVENNATFLLESTTTGDDARLNVGWNGGQGQVVIDQSQATILAASGGEAIVDIGRGGGQGLVRVAGQGSNLTISGGTQNGVIRIATSDDGSEGVLWVGAGASVTVGRIEMGGADVDLSALVLAGGLVTASNGVTVTANAGIGGSGTLAGSVTLSDGFISVGDTYDIVSGEFGTALGELDISGNVFATGGAAQFQFGASGADFLDIAGALQLNTTTIEVTYDGSYTPDLGMLQQMLARASDGITLDAIVLDHNLGTAPNQITGVELRAGGTELWFYHGPATVTLSGVVDIREVTAGAVNAAGTDVRFTTGDGDILTTTTDAAGAFSFDLPIGATGTLDFVRDYTTAAPAMDKGLTTQDVIRMFRLVSGRIAEGDYTPEDIIAADFNGNGAANLTDVLDLFRFVSGRDADPSPRYIFVNDDADLSGVTRTSVPLDGPITIDAMLADASLSVTAILSGDLNGHV